MSGMPASGRPEPAGRNSPRTEALAPGRRPIPRGPAADPARAGVRLGLNGCVPPRAIDFHVHLPTPDWLDGSMAGYVEAAEAYFRSPVQRGSLDQLAGRYRGLGVRAVLLAWDAETATGRPRVPNETVAAIASLGLRGVKFHPSLQAFSPDDPRYWPVFAACERHGLLALFHTGTSAIGARRPGAQRIRIDYSPPLKLAPFSAAHPGLTVLAAHFGWRWHAD